MPQPYTQNMYGGLGRGIREGMTGLAQGIAMRLERDRQEQEQRAEAGYRRAQLNLDVWNNKNNPEKVRHSAYTDFMKAVNPNQPIMSFEEFTEKPGQTVLDKLGKKLVGMGKEFVQGKQIDPQTGQVIRNRTQNMRLLNIRGKQAIAESNVEYHSVTGKTMTPEIIKTYQGLTGGIAPQKPINLGGEIYDPNIGKFISQGLQGKRPTPFERQKQEHEEDKLDFRRTEFKGQQKTATRTAGIQERKIQLAEDKLKKSQAKAKKTGRLNPVEIRRYVDNLEKRIGKRDEKGSVVEVSSDEAWKHFYPIRDSLTTIDTKRRLATEFISRFGLPYGILEAGTVDFVGEGSQKSTLPEQQELPTGITEADIEYTMQQEGMTREEVLEAFKKKSGR
jgi:hypothetical protein